jgi:hypothetical protein
MQSVITDFDNGSIRFDEIMDMLAWYTGNSKPTKITEAELLDLD